MLRPVILSCLFVGIAVGCSQQPPAPPPNQGGINITAPGVNISIDEKGTKVQAPNVNVEAGPKGTKVEAPNVNIKVPADK